MTSLFAILKQTFSSPSPGRAGVGLLSHLKRAGVGLLLLLTFTGCIEPPLKLPAQEVIVDLPIVLMDLEVVWDLNVDWHSTWYYDWDNVDSTLWGPISYPEPSTYELRRYYLGQQPSVPHTQVDPPYTLQTTHFRKTYEFGYYDMLIWSNIDSEDGTQVVVVDENNIDEVTATTTVTRGMTRVGSSATVTEGTSVLTGTNEGSVVTGLYNQPEIFYSTYVQDVHISRDPDDYDYFDEEERCWVKKINSELEPLVYIYLVQVILYNNDGRIVGSTGDNAISSFASGTSINTGHTWDKPVMVYFGSRMKEDVYIKHKGVSADIIGGKFTTYGLCDMEAYSRTRGTSIYQGSRTDLKNFLYVDLQFSNGTASTLQVDVTDQCQQQAHGGVITVELNALDITPPSPGEQGSGSLFVPTVEDYDEIEWDIIM